MGQMAQEMVGKRLTLMCVEVSGELREPNPHKRIVSSKTGFFGEGVGKGMEKAGPCSCKTGALHMEADR